MGVKDENWHKAILGEIKTLEKNGTWMITYLSPRKKAIEFKWVYKTNYNSDGTFERHKARLIILKNHQTEGIDFTETFTLIAKMVIV